MAESETVLLEQYVRTQDAFAFRELVEQHQDMVFAACHRVLGNRADAEDASQNCFLKLAQAAGRPRSPIAGWLHTVAVQGSIDMLRSGIARRARERSVAVHPDQTQPCESAWADVLGEVDAAIVALPERLRTPIVLYFLERRTQAEVAVEMGLVHQSVSRRLRRGVEALRRRLKRSGIVAPAVALTAMLTANTAEAAPAALAATLGKVALAGAGGTKVAAVGATLVTLKTAVVLAASAGAVVGGLVVHQATRPPRPTPLAAATPAPPAKKKALPTVAVALDAQVTLTAERTRVEELAKLIQKQTGVNVAYNAHTPWDSFVRDLKPGTHKLRDVLARVEASTSLTTELLADRDRVVLCLWQKPDAQVLAEMIKLAVSADVVERCTAARWLELVAGRDALVQLLKMLADPDARVRYFAARAVVDGWTDARGHGSAALPCVAPEGTALAVAKAIEISTWPKTQEFLFDIAGSLRDPKVLPALMKQLENMTKRGARVMYANLAIVCETIARIGGPDAEAVLLATADDLPRQATEWAMSSLGVLGTDKAIARLGKQIDIEAKKRKHRRLYPIIKALRTSDNPAAARELIRILKMSVVTSAEDTAIIRYLATRVDVPEARAVCLARFNITTDPTMRSYLARMMADVPAVRKILLAELDQEGIVGRRAAYALGFTRDPRIIRALIEAINSKPVLGKEGPTMVGPESPAVSALRMLAHLGGPEAEKVLIAEAKGRDSQKREVAVESLGNYSSPGVRELLRAALKDPMRHIRTAAARALAVRPDLADIDLLLASARIDAPDPQFAAPQVWEALAAIGGERAAKELMAQVARGSHVAGQALSRSQDPHCKKAIRDAFAGDDAKLHGLLLDGFNTNYPPPLNAYYAVTAAMAELPNADETLKRARMRLLGWTRDPRGTEALTGLLLNAKESRTVRRVAAQTLRGRHGKTDPGAVEALRHAFEHDADRDVRLWAEKALRSWGVDLRKQPKKPTPKNPPDEREFPAPPEP